MDRDPDDPPALVLTGELDAAGRHELRQRIHEVIDAHVGDVVEVDLREVTFIDSAALGVLVGCYKRARTGGGSMRLVNIPTRIDLVLGTTGVDKYLTSER